eukprot:m.75850 g.75850  ORF g.75850 m.75850 type:complete len:52 (+) comp8498_c1_seq1:85-240(+)
MLEKLQTPSLLLTINLAENRQTLKKKRTKLKKIFSKKKKGVASALELQERG